MDDPAQILAPDQYTLPQAAEARRKMAMELMYGSGQTQQPEMKHWSQALGNIGNRYVGNNMFNNANTGQRQSVVGDATQFQKEMGNNMMPQSPVPFSGMGGQPGIGGLPPSPPPPPMPPPPGGPPMPPNPNQNIGMMQPQKPIQFPGAGGLPQQEQWPQALFGQG